MQCYINLFLYAPLPKQPVFKQSLYNLGKRLDGSDGWIHTHTFNAVCPCSKRPALLRAGKDSHWTSPTTLAPPPAVLQGTGPAAGSVGGGPST
jgi:hypothetical protein